MYKLKGPAWVIVTVGVVIVTVRVAIKVLTFGVEGLAVAE